MKLPLLTSNYCLHPKIRLILDILVAVLGLTAVFFGIIRPTINHVSKLHKSIYNEYQDLENRYRQGYTMRTLSQQLEEAKKKLPLLSDIFYDPQNPLTRIQWLEKMAKDHRLLADLSPLTEVANPNGQLTLEMQASGTWINIKQFLQSLDQAPYYIIIDRLSVLSGATEKMQIFLTLRLYPLPGLFIDL